MSLINVTRNALERTNVALNEVEHMLDDLPVDMMNGENILAVEKGMSNVRIHMHNLEDALDAKKAYKMHPVRLAGIIAGLIISIYVVLKGVSRLFDIPKHMKYRKELGQVEERFRELDRAKIHLRNLIKLHKSYSKKISKGEISKNTPFYEWYILQHDPNGTEHEYLVDLVEESKDVINTYADMIRADYPEVATEMRSIQEEMTLQISEFAKGMISKRFDPNKKAPGNLEKLGVSAIMLIEDFEKALTRVIGGNVSRIKKDMEMSIEDFKKVEKEVSKG